MRKENRRSASYSAQASDPSKIFFFEVIDDETEEEIGNESVVDEIISQEEYAQRVLQEAVDEFIYFRKRSGIPVPKWSEDLRFSAEQVANEYANKHGFDESVSTLLPFGRSYLSGTSFRGMAGACEEGAPVKAWLQSSTHKQILQCLSMENFGMACVKKDDEYYYVVLVFDFRGHNYASDSDIEEYRSYQRQ